MSFFRLLIQACCFFCFVSCQTTAKKTVEPLTPVQGIPSFSGDSAWYYVKQQTLFGPRVPNTTAHQACKNYLVHTLKVFGAQVETQDVTLTAFDGTPLASTNIIASFFTDKTRRILLCAHWDSRPWADNDPDPSNHQKPVMGANDGASGVGVLLEVARLLGQTSINQPPAVGIDIVLFDAEDYGTPTWYEGRHTDDSWGLGSQYWASEAKKNGYSAKYGILLDMVGDANPQFLWEYFSLQFAPSVLGKVWSTAASLGYAHLFQPKRGGAVTDDHLYVNQLAGIPCIDIIDYDPSRRNGFVDYWHTVYDNLDKIDRRTLQAVGTTLVTLIYSE